MTNNEQIIKECSYNGECQMMGCFNDDNCFIKQLFEERNRAERELYHKEQECEELKEANDSILTTLNVLAKSNIKLRETLAEIKEIAEDADRKLFTTKSDDYTEGYCWLGRIILQKINEVEDDRT